MGWDWYRYIEYKDTNDKIEESYQARNNRVTEVKGVVGDIQ